MFDFPIVDVHHYTHLRHEETSRDHVVVVSLATEKFIHEVILDFDCFYLF